jgi:hypothetical protein
VLERERMSNRIALLSTYYFVTLVQIMILLTIFSYLFGFHYSNVTITSRNVNFHVNWTQEKMYEY